MFDTEIIKDLIKSKRLTQQEFADMIGKTKQTINNYFTGRTKIDIDTLIVIAKVLNVEISYFFDEKSGNNNVGSFHNSTVINTKDSNFRVNTDSKDVDAKNKELRKNNLHYWGMIESLIDNQSELLVKIVEEAPQLQPFIAKQKETKRFIAQINTLTKLTDHTILFSDNFFDFFENPY